MEKPILLSQSVGIRLDTATFRLPLWNRRPTRRPVQRGIVTGKCIASPSCWLGVSPTKVRTVCHRHHAPPHSCPHQPDWTLHRPRNVAPECHDLSPHVSNRMHHRDSANDLALFRLVTCGGDCDKSTTTSWWWQELFWMASSSTQSQSN